MDRPGALHMNPKVKKPSISIYPFFEPILELKKDIIEIEVYFYCEINMKYARRIHLSLLI